MATCLYIESCRWGMCFICSVSSLLMGHVQGNLPIESCRWGTCLLTLIGGVNVFLCSANVKSCR